jgi:hypothetical protein
MLSVDLLLTSDSRELHVERVRSPTIPYLFGILYIMRQTVCPARHRDSTSTTKLQPVVERSPQAITVVVKPRILRIASSHVNCANSCSHWLLPSFGSTTPNIAPMSSTASHIYVPRLRSDSIPKTTSGKRREAIAPSCRLLVLIHN